MSSTRSNADKSVEARLAAIESKDAASRTPDDWDYLFANDQKLAEITKKENQHPGILTAEEVDYEQKARGFVNTMANLSAAEKALYDKAVAFGDTQAAEGVSEIAFIRAAGHTAAGANGTTYDPTKTEITAANIEKYFSYKVVDSSGKTRSRFQALTQFLQAHPSA